MWGKVMKQKPYVLHRKQIRLRKHKKAKNLNEYDAAMSQRSKNREYII